jgi:hypothetical protein
LSLGKRVEDGGGEEAGARAQFENAQIRLAKPDEFTTDGLKHVRPTRPRLRGAFPITSISRIAQVNRTWNVPRIHECNLL